MTALRFTKMEGAGNDFIVLDNRKALITAENIARLAPKLCDRRFGIGADGILMLENPADPEKAAFTMIYKNADGSDAGMCGNGGRCLALFADKLGLGSRLRFTVHDKWYEADVHKNGEVSVYFPPAERPEKLTIGQVSYLKIFPGTEHVVRFVDADFLQNEQQLTNEGRNIRYARELMSEGTNVNFVSLINNEELQLVTYERGVEALTLACGTGAIAAAAAAFFKDAGNRSTAGYSVRTKGGQLYVSFTFNKNTGLFEEIALKGPAKIVYEGTINV